MEGEKGKGDAAEECARTATVETLRGEAPPKEIIENS